MKLEEADVAELASVLTIDEPLGPSNAESLIDRPRAAKLLFERQNSIYQELMTRSGILVGRRGAGKTAFLNQLRASTEYRVIIFMNAPDVFPTILATVRRIFGAAPPMVEVVEKLWEVLIWSCIFNGLIREMGDNDARSQELQDFINQFNISGTDKPEKVIQRVIERIQSLASKLQDGIETPTQLFDTLSFENSSFESCRELAKQILHSWQLKTKSPVLVLMDTLEEYKLDQNEAKHGVAGLLRYLGRQSGSQNLVDIRFCLPAELYSEFQNLSSNVEKDFSTQTILHWAGADLLRIVAQRLQLYAAIHDLVLAKRIGGLKVNDRVEALSFFQKFLPYQVNDGMGFSEPPMVYVLRHTQLLPRQVIQIFNRMLVQAIDRESRAIGAVTAKMVLRSVEESQRLICSGVSQAYKHRYESLDQLCRAAIPELTMRFKDGDLRKVFNINVKALLQRWRNEGRDIEMDYHQFKRMLIEVGAIGKQTGETEYYHEALFEYTVPGRMVESLADGFCLHPVFSGTYPKSTNGQQQKKIYPFGCIPGE